MPHSPWQGGGRDLIARGRQPGPGKRAARLQPSGRTAAHSCIEAPLLLLLLYLWLLLLLLLLRLLLLLHGFTDPLITCRWWLARHSSTRLSSPSIMRRLRLGIAC